MWVKQKHDPGHSKYTVYTKGLENIKKNMKVAEIQLAKANINRNCFT
jgi:hypothetical protein